MNDLLTVFRDRKTCTSIEADHIIMSMKFMLQGEGSVIAMGILECIKNNMPATDIIREVRGMIEDNCVVMAVMLGSNLTVRIQNFKP